MADVDRLADAKRRAQNFNVIDGGGGGNDIDPMEARVTSLEKAVTKLEMAVEKLQAGVDAFRHNQTIMFSAVVFVLTIGLGAIFFVGNTTLTELRAMNQRIDRILERQSSPVTPAPPTK